MSIDALETSNHIRRDVEELLERVGVVQSAQLTIVVVAWDAMITRTLDVDSRERESLAVGEETLEELVVEIVVDLRRRVVGPIADRRSNRHIVELEGQIALEQEVTGGLGRQLNVVRVGEVQLEWDQRVTESHGEAELISDLWVQTVLVFVEIAALEGKETV